jgi:hypothetical protein
MAKLINLVLWLKVDTAVEKFHTHIPVMLFWDEGTANTLLAIDTSSKQEKMDARIFLST